MEIIRPRGLSDALEFLHKHGHETLPLAGGTDLMVMLREKKIKAQYILDLNPLSSELSYVKIDQDTVNIGSLTTLWELSKSTLHRDYRFAGFVDLWSRFGTMVLRFEATIGGNIATATRYNDYITLLLAYDANVRLISTEGERIISIEDFVISSGKTSRRSQELIKEISFKLPSENCSSSFFKIDRREALIPGFINSAVYMCLNPEDEVVDIKIAYNMLKNKNIPGRLKDIENLLLKKKYDDAYIREVAETFLGDHIEARTSWHSIGEYRVHLAKISLSRSLRLVRERLMSKKYISWEEFFKKQ